MFLFNFQIVFQLILQSDSGMDYKGFFKFLSLIAEHRIDALSFMICEQRIVFNSDQQYYFCLSRNFQTESSSESHLNNITHDKSNTKCDRENKDISCELPFAFCSDSKLNGKNTIVKDSISFSQNTLTCPHWSHCGIYLALFDLQQIKNIVTDMLKQAEFETIILQLTSDPNSLILKIDETIHFFR